MWILQSIGARNQEGVFIRTIAKSFLVRQGDQADKAEMGLIPGVGRLLGQGRAVRDRKDLKLLLVLLMSLCSLDEYGRAFPAKASDCDLR